MKLTKYLAVGLLSASLIAMELIWTRIFSAEFFYTFAFLILSLAILGLGLGALSLRFFPKLDNEKRIASYISLSSLMIIIGPVLVFQLGINFPTLFSNFSEIVKLIFALFLLGAPYFLGGIALAVIFKNYSEDMPKIYMYDLAGAGIGVFLAIIFMNVIGTQQTAVWAALPAIAAAFLFTSKKISPLPVIAAVLMIILSFYASDTLRTKKDEPARVIYEHWDAMAKLKIYEYNQMYRGINIDNHASTTVIGFPGGYNDSLLQIHDYFGINIGYLIRQFEHTDFLALGSGGGKDVAHALAEGAEKVYAVEVNPHINYLVTEGDLSRFTGNLMNDPRVEVVTEDARAYVRKYEDKFDVIFAFSANSYAALASGAFALAENYLFTVEAFEDYWHSLSDSGYLVMEHHFYVPRLVSEMMEAAENLGIDDIKKHIAVYDMPEWRRKLLLVSKKPLDKQTISYAVGGLGPEFHNIQLLFPPQPATKDNVINQIIQRGWEEVADEVPYDISPSYDDRPFTPQMGLWKNFTMEKLDKLEGFEEFFGFPLSKMIILLILIIVSFVIVPLNLLPFLKKGKKMKAPAWMYFFFIGMGFMMVEVIMIQKYTLFIGPSVYSIVTILLSMLIISGIGSRFSAKLKPAAVFGGIIILLLIDIFVFTELIYVLEGLGLPFRIFFTALFLAPVSFLMGMPFPKGALRAGAFTDWGFAVNGAASVLGSTLIVLIAFSYGFKVSLLLGAAMYAFAFLIMRNPGEWK